MKKSINALLIASMLLATGEGIAMNGFFQKLSKKGQDSQNSGSDQNSNDNSERDNEQNAGDDQSDSSGVEEDRELGDILRTIPDLEYKNATPCMQNEQEDINKFLNLKKLGIPGKFNHLKLSDIVITKVGEKEKEDEGLKEDETYLEILTENQKAQLEKLNISKNSCLYRFGIADACQKVRKFQDKCNEYTREISELGKIKPVNIDNSKLDNCVPWVPKTASTNLISLLKHQRYLVDIDNELHQMNSVGVLEFKKKADITKLKGQKLALINKLITMTSALVEENKNRIEGIINIVAQIKEEPGSEVLYEALCSHLYIGDSCLKSEIEAIRKFEAQNFLPVLKEPIYQDDFQLINDVHKITNCFLTLFKKYILYGEKKIQLAKIRVFCEYLEQQCIKHNPVSVLALLEFAPKYFKNISEDDARKLVKRLKKRQAVLGIIELTLKSLLNNISIVQKTILSKNIQFRLKPQFKSQDSVTYAFAPFYVHVLGQFGSLLQLLGNNQNAFIQYCTAGGDPAEINSCIRNIKVENIEDPANINKFLGPILYTIEKKEFDIDPFLSDYYFWPLLNKMVSNLSSSEIEKSLANLNVAKVVFNGKYPDKKFENCKFEESLYSFYVFFNKEMIDRSQLCLEGLSLECKKNTSFLTNFPFFKPKKTEQIAANSGESAEFIEQQDTYNALGFSIEKVKPGGDCGYAALGIKRADVANLFRTLLQKHPKHQLTTALQQCFESSKDKKVLKLLVEFDVNNKKRTPGEVSIFDWIHYFIEMPETGFQSHPLVKQCFNTWNNFLGIGSLGGIIATLMGMPVTVMYPNGRRDVFSPIMEIEKSLKLSTRRNVDPSRGIFLYMKNGDHFDYAVPDNSQLGSSSATFPQYFPQAGAYLTPELSTLPPLFPLIAPEFNETPLTIFTPIFTNALASTYKFTKENISNYRGKYLSTELDAGMGKFPFFTMVPGDLRETSRLSLNQYGTSIETDEFGQPIEINYLLCISACKQKKQDFPLITAIPVAPEDPSVFAKFCSATKRKIEGMAIQAKKLAVAAKFEIDMAQLENQISLGNELLGKSSAKSSAMQADYLRYGRVWVLDKAMQDKTGALTAKNSMQKASHERSEEKHYRDDINSRVKEVYKEVNDARDKRRMLLVELKKAEIDNKIKFGANDTIVSILPSQVEKIDETISDDIISAANKETKNMTLQSNMAQMPMEKFGNLYASFCVPFGSKLSGIRPVFRVETGEDIFNIHIARVEDTQKDILLVIPQEPDDWSRLKGLIKGAGEKVKSTFVTLFDAWENTRQEKEYRKKRENLQSKIMDLEIKQAKLQKELDGLGFLSQSTDFIMKTLSSVNTDSIMSTIANLSTDAVVKGIGANNEEKAKNLTGNLLKITQQLNALYEEEKALEIQRDIELGIAEISEKGGE